MAEKLRAFAPSHKPSGLDNPEDLWRFAKCLSESKAGLQDVRDGRPPYSAIGLARKLGKRDPEEAIWIAFLVTHIGWEMPASFNTLYHLDGHPPHWTWRKVTACPRDFLDWLRCNSEHLKRCAPFGNHRKFETHKPSERGSAAVAKSYLDWATQNQDRSQQERIKSLLEPAGGPEDAFELLYRSVKKHVKRFDRLASYDFVRLLGYLGLAKVRPGRCYLDGATGPKKGALLMFGNHLSVADLEDRCGELAASLGVGLDVIEDALCNWQKDQLH